MATFTHLTLITDDSGHYCVAVTNTDTAKYIHRDGTLHNRTDIRDDGTKKSHNGGHRTPKQISRSIKKALKAKLI